MGWGGGLVGRYACLQGSPRRGSVFSVVTCLQQIESDAKQSDGGGPLDLPCTEICTETFCYNSRSEG